MDYASNEADELATWLYVMLDPCCSRCDRLYEYPTDDCVTEELVNAWAKRTALAAIADGWRFDWDRKFRCPNCLQ